LLQAESNLPLPPPEHADESMSISCSNNKRACNLSLADQFQLIRKQHRNRTM
jgi:hypothetical protein